MKLNFRPQALQRQVFFVSMTAALSLVAVVPLRAATTQPAKADVATAPVTNPARQCLAGLEALQGQMNKGGYWRGGMGFGYGYPMDGYGYDRGIPGPAVSASAPGVAEYWRARPGYDVRTLLAAAQILGERGQQSSCEALLGETRELYGRYAAQMRSGHVPRDDVSRWRQAQLATAEPVTSKDVSYRSDQLIGTEVLSPKGEELGSVDDMVLSPQTGKIAYLVIARGGLFGIDRKYVPVPWSQFKATAGAKMLVLDTTKADMSAAPRVAEDRFAAADDKQSQQVDAYWTAHLAK